MTIQTEANPEEPYTIVITEVIEMGGAERACLALARWMNRQRLRAKILTYRDQVGLQRFADYELPVLELKPRMTARKKIQALRSYFKAHSTAPKPLMSGYQPALHATLAGITGFNTLMHDTPSLFSAAYEASSFRRRVTRSISDRITAHGLRSGGATIVTSNYLREECARVFGVDAAIARMGGFASAHSFRPRPVANSLRMLSVSRIEQNKRIDWMIRALAKLEEGRARLSARIDWRLDVAGKGSELPRLEELAQQLGLSNRVCFHGFVSDEQLQQLYDTAQLFLMPAVQGYGIPAIEALQRGIPVVLHRDSGVSDILLNTPWANVFEGGESAFAQALGLAITSVMDGKQMGNPLPTIPTEDDWAEQVALLCHWV